MKFFKILTMLSAAAAAVYEQAFKPATEPACYLQH